MLISRLDSILQARRRTLLLIADFASRLLSPFRPLFNLVRDDHCIPCCSSLANRPRGLEQPQRGIFFSLHAGDHCVFSVGRYSVSFKLLLRSSIYCPSASKSISSPLAFGRMSSSSSFMWCLTLSETPVNFASL